MTTAIDREEEDEDPVAEVRRHREEFAAQFGFDIRRMGEYLRKTQYNCGHKVVEYDPNSPNQMRVVYDPAVDAKPPDVP
jgi:hypothetical protein